jgi:hypothetical protein
VWQDNNLTASAKPAGVAAMLGALDGYSTPDGNQHVNYISLNGHVHELLYKGHHGRTMICRSLEAGSRSA